MNETLFTILWFAAVIGLPSLLIAIAGYFTVWRGKWKLYVALNLAVIIAIGGFVAVEGAGDQDMSAPVPGILNVLFLFAYLPGHLVFAGLIGGLYWWLRRRRSPTTE